MLSRRVGLLLVLMAAACGGSRQEASRLEPRIPAPMPAAIPGAAPARDVSGGMMERETAAGSVALAPASPRQDGDSGVGLGGAAAPKQKPMLDIEARLQIESDDVPVAVAKLRALVEQNQGYVVTESVTTDKFSPPQAEVSLRVPSRSVEAFFHEVERLGSLRGRTVQARDVGKEYFDAELRLQTLERTKARYEELLAQAKNVEEMVVVEARLEDVRERVERLKGEMRWLQDRTAQATVHVFFFSPPAMESPYEEPSARFFPGVRTSYARNIGGNYGSSDFFGLGLSVRFSRHFSIDVEGLPSVDAGYGGEDLDVFLATLGGEIYSDFLGGGRRRFLNPYVGVRAGYARFLQLDQIAVGGVLGLELIKTPLFHLDLETRSYLLFFSGDQAHALIQPGLSFNVAF